MKSMTTLETEVRQSRAALVKCVARLRRDLDAKMDLLKGIERDVWPVRVETDPAALEGALARFEEMIRLARGLAPKARACVKPTQRLQRRLAAARKARLARDGRRAGRQRRASL